MPLDAEQMQEIMTDVLLGRPVRHEGPDVDKFVEALEPDIKLAKRNNWTIDIPPEFNA